MKPIAFMSLLAVVVLAAGTVSAGAAQRSVRSAVPEAGDSTESGPGDQQVMSWATFRHRQFAEGVVGNYWDNGYALSPAFWGVRGITAGIEGIRVNDDRSIYDPSIAGAYPDDRRGQRRGRSAVSGTMGKYCTTPVKSCLLNNPSNIGGGCSCKVPGGRSSGQVTP